MKHFGFTLSELLIALAILGLIATFTIPKLVDSIQTQGRDAVIKETIATLNQVGHELVMTGEPITYDNFLARLNVVRRCGAVGEGCWDHPYNGGSIPGGFTNGMVVFHNGAMLTDFEPHHTFSTCPDQNKGDPRFLMDWNGAAGPNLVGEDQLDLKINLGATECQDTRPFGGVSGRGSSSENLLEAVFSH